MGNLTKITRPRALITGLRGFTGAYLASELTARGYQVFGTAYGNEALGTGVYHVDLCDREAVQEVVDRVQPEIVAHLAAVAFVGHDYPEDIYRINIMGTRNLLDALSHLKNSPKSVLVASSANIYGNSTAGTLSEQEPAMPTNDYAISKMAMEHVARLWMDKLPVFITRPFNYVGVGQAENFLIPKIVSHFKRRAPVIELGNIDVSREFSDVRAVAYAYAELLGLSPRGETINICNGKAYTLREVIGLAESLTGHTIDIRCNPAFVRANEVRTLVGDASKLKSLIGDLPSYSLLDTLAWMLDETSAAATKKEQSVKVVEVFN
ncbi:GDP-mannose 4,6-dehydratase [Undibacterium baiyunense]|uniref:GDP-mannose 4,6-dehydratase n=1 Tax=Undibacterium baiyunense TaxID=2828731 RepID=A0A941DGR6_9BURK|nr:GDP-mannose 4,6-dehydratase [Undibacterium baiyunense]MBR7748479.1 GDP-mannose 4,6-dehydratase [Undibacterium baiyunense]